LLGTLLFDATPYVAMSSSRERPCGTCGLPACPSGTVDSTTRSGRPRNVCSCMHSAAVASAAVPASVAPHPREWASLVVATTKHKLAATPLL
jgi:hypothetical protein